MAAVYLAGKRAGTSRVLPPAHVPARHVLARASRRTARRIVYGAAWDGRPFEIFIRRVGSPESRPFGLPRRRLLGVSRTGELAVSARAARRRPLRTRGTLARCALAGGGAPRELLEDVEGADWAPDGTASPSSATVDGRRSARVPDRATSSTRPPAGSAIRAFPPTGDLVAFLEHPVRGDDRGSVAVVDLSGRAVDSARTLRGRQGLAWSPGAAEIWFTAAPRPARTAGLYASRRPARTGCLPRPGVLTLHDVARDGRVLITQDTDRSGCSARAPGRPKERDLSWLDWSLARTSRPTDNASSSASRARAADPDTRSTCARPTARPRSGSAEGSPQPVSRRPVGARGHRASDPQRLVVFDGAGEARTLSREGLSNQTAVWFPDGARRRSLRANPTRAAPLDLGPRRRKPGPSRPRATGPSESASPRTASSSSPAVPIGSSTSIRARAASRRRLRDLVPGYARRLDRRRTRSLFATGARSAREGLSAEDRDRPKGALERIDASRLGRNHVHLPVVTSVPTGTSTPIPS